MEAHPPLLFLDLIAAGKSQTLAGKVDKFNPYDEHQEYSLHLC
jgi:hypothetical protein